jgi:hypothetical protein
VAEELRLIGVSRADDAVATAQARRLSVSDVRTLIAEWQGNAGAWGVGALYQRLTGQMSAWPPAAADYTRARAREASLRNHEAVVAERLAGERRQQADDELFAERDARHRSTIEAMKPEEVDAALDNPALVRIHRERGRSSRMVRERLFDAIERGGATAEVVAAN